MGFSKARLLQVVHPLGQGHLTATSHYKWEDVFSFLLGLPLSFISNLLQKLVATRFFIN